MFSYHGISGYLSPEFKRGGAVVKPMWHRYRKHFVSKVSIYELSLLSLAKRHCKEQLWRRNDWGEQNQAGIEKAVKDDGQSVYKEK